MFIDIRDKDLSQAVAQALVQMLDEETKAKLQQKVLEKLDQALKLMVEEALVQAIVSIRVGDRYISEEGRKAIEAEVRKALQGGSDDAAATTAKASS